MRPKGGMRTGGRKSKFDVSACFLKANFIDIETIVTLVTVKK